MAPDNSWGKTQGFLAWRRRGAIGVEGPSRRVAKVARDNSCVCQKTEAEEGCRGVRQRGEAEEGCRGGEGGGGSEGESRGEEERKGEEKDRE